jgi:hypothetical protein
VFVLKKSTRFSENTRYYLSYSKKQAKILGGFEIFRPIVTNFLKNVKNVKNDSKNVKNDFVLKGFEILQKCN